MYKVRRIKALIIKEFFQILRDPSSLVIATIFPIFLLCMYGYGISLDIKNLKVGLIAEDSSETAKNFIFSLSDSPFFKVTRGEDPQVFGQMLTNLELDVIVWIPSYFSAYMQAAMKEKEHPKAPIFVITDGSSPNTATFAQNYILGAWGNTRAQLINSERYPLSSPVHIEQKFWFNEELNSRYYLVPGSIAIIITLIGTLLTALMIAREWERGTMEALMATPVTITEILLSKLIPYFLLGVISVIISTVIGHYFFAVPLRGSIIALSLVSFFFLLVALGIGLLISSSCKDQFNAAQIALISAFLPAFMLSGFIFEISSMPLWIRLLTYIFPARYFVSSLQTLFLAGDVWPLIIRCCFILMTFCLLLFALIKSKIKKSLE
jgi:ABC-2 type transport system permease protein